MALKRHRRVTVPASSYIAGVFPPTLESQRDGDALITKSTNIRLLQRVIASDELYRSAQGRFDTVLVTKKGLGSSQSIHRWRCNCSFARVLRMINIPDFFRHHQMSAPL